MTTETRWYDNPDSACPTCGHGPRWHNDPSGCTRMTGGWCPCERRYGALSQGPDDYVGRDGSYYGAHTATPDPSGSDNCATCGGALLPDRDLGIRKHAAEVPAPIPDRYSLDPSEAHARGLHDDESDLECDACREVLGLEGTYNE